MPRQTKKFAWYALAFTLGAGALYWALVLRVGSARSLAATVAGRAAIHAPSAPAQRTITLVDSPQRRPAAADRKAELEALFAEPNVPKKLSTVLAAVESEPSAPEQDPLWSQMVASLADVWRGDTLDHGLDLMVSEARPRARRALVSSFAFLANSERARELTPAQSQTLTNDFIDMYKQLPPAQQPEVLAALRKVAGTDVADVLVGRTSELERQYARALDEAKATPRQAAQNLAAQ